MMKNAVERLRTWSDRLFASRLFAYTILLLLQMKIVWGAWLLRDLTSGDTSSYFKMAWRWYQQGSLYFTWSPLYISFFGTLFHLSRDAYTVTTLHRILTVLGADLVVLALMRRLLPAGIAWLMAAWWVVLPIDFDALYEVHIFAVIPIAASVLAILWKPGPTGRGLSVSMLAASAVLMRNELMIGAAILAAATLLWDLRHHRGRIPKAYGVPAAVCAVIILFYYTHSADRAPAAMHDYIKHKHSLNVCQTFAFGYQQRHADFTASPWTECQQLMTRIFDAPEPSMEQAVRSNPQAMLEHFWWNVRLIPNGLQVLLFNAMSGSVTPDYPPVPIHPYYALAMSLAALAISALGAVLILRDSAFWWKFWIEDRIWGWIALLSIAIVIAVVMITQRPRPSYMFALGIMLRALIGMFLFASLRRFRWAGIFEFAVMALVVACALAAPSYYEFTNPSGDRPLATMYWRLAPFQAQLEKPGSKLAAMRSSELCNYLGKSDICKGLESYQLRAEVNETVGWEKVLANHGATLFYADEGLLKDRFGQDFLSNAESRGWRVAALHSKPNEYWAVFQLYADRR